MSLVGTFKIEEAEVRIFLTEENELKASTISKQLVIAGMCNYDKATPDLKQRLIIVLKDSQFDLTGSTLKITLNYKPIDAELPQDLMHIFATMYLNDSNLTELCLYEHLVDKRGIALAKALESNKTLAKLNLESNSIGYKGTKALAKALELNNTLTELDLGWNNIRVIIELAKALEVNKTLIKLNLHRNYLNDSQAKMLLRACKVNVRLNELDLSGNNDITDEQKIHLSELAVEVNAERPSAVSQAGKEALSAGKEALSFAFLLYPNLKTAFENTQPEMNLDAFKFELRV